MQTDNRLFDDLARLAGGAFSSFSALKDEAESRLHAQVEHILARMELVRRDEFDAVRATAIKAREEEERLKNIARAYAREVVATAQGEKAQMIAEARAYKSRKVNRAEGQAARFSDLLTQYEQAPEVTRSRLYLETMGEVLSGSHLVLDSGDGNSMTYLPLDKIIDKSGAKKPANDNAPSADSDNVGGDVPSSPSSSSGSQNNGDSGSGNNGQSDTSNYESQALRSRSRNS